MEIIAAVIIGSAFGHLLDLLYDRFFTGEPVGGRLYRCRQCRAPLRTLFALPLAGYFWTRGRCPDCREPLPWRALVLPAGGAALFVAAYLVFDELGAALLGGFFATIFLALSVTDLDQRLLPNRIVYPSILIAIALCWGWPQNDVVEILAGGGVAIGIAVGLLLFSLPFGAGAFGMGDVKMIVLMGFVTGFPSIVVGVFVGTLAAGLLAALLIVTRLRGMRDYIPHGPFLALGAVVALFWGQDLWDR